MIPNLEKDITVQEYYIDAKIFNKILMNEIQKHMKMIIYLDQMEFIPALQSQFSIKSSTNIIHDINIIKDKKKNT